MSLSLNHIYKILFVVLLITPAVVGVNGQNVLDRHVELSSGRASTKAFLIEIEQQTDLVFSYSSRLCFRDSVKPALTSGCVREILNELFFNCPSTYIVRGNKVIIQPAKEKERKFVIRGYVLDNSTKEALIHANVYEPNLVLGTVSNNFGFYSISLSAGQVRLNSSYVGYQNQHHDINLTSDTILNFLMMPKAELEEVAVVGTRVPDKVKSTRTGTINVPIEQIKNVPVFLGEVDVVKSIQLLPGIQSGGEGFSELYVRGGGPDQNLVLMDDVPVYNVSHLFGFFSIFNADAVNNVTVIKGGFPARYGGRLSSVVDIRLYDGNSEEFKGVASVGLLSSRIAVEGPLAKDKSSFSVSFRRTYFDVLTSVWQLNQVEKSRYYFYDFNAKFNYKLSDRDRLYLSTYMGKDQYGVTYNKQDIVLDNPNTGATQTFTASDESDVGWKNYVGAMRWNHIFGTKMFSNLTMTYSDYRFYINQTLNYVLDSDWSVGQKNYYSGVRDYSAKFDVDYMPSPKHYFRFGGSAVLHAFFPGIDVQLREITGGEPVDTAVASSFADKELYRPELRFYLEDDFQLSSRLKLNIGGHFSLFQAESKTYWSAEPRLSARLMLRKRLSLKAAYSEMTQYMHLLRTASVALPTDLWLPVSDDVAPMRAMQATFGFEYEFGKGFSLSLEAYYKKLSDILAYKESAGYFDFTSDWQNKLTSGRGKSIGFELLLHKKIGDLSGWFGYTYSKSTNTFDELNNGKEFPANFDRTHDVSAYLTYKFSKKVDMGVTWTFGTGNPITLPETKYYAPDLPSEEQPFSAKYNQFINRRNGYRMPNFHRLDIGLNFHKKKKWGSRLWSVGLMNSYGRQNPFFLYFSDTENLQTGDITRSLRQFSLFPIPIPYVRYTVKF